MLCLADDIFSDSKIDRFCDEGDEVIFVNQKSSPMLDMDIRYSSSRSYGVCEPTGRREADMRNNSRGIFSRNSLERAPESPLPERGERTVGNGFNNRKILSTSECLHFYGKEFLKNASVLLDASWMVECVG